MKISEDMPLTTEENQGLNSPKAWTVERVRSLRLSDSCVDAADWLEAEDEPDAPLVHELIERGEMVAVVGQSKAGKSFLALQLAACVALGLPFLGRETAAENVYIANLEVSRKQYKKRLRRLVNALGVSTDELRGRLFIDNMKGESASWKKCLVKCKRNGCTVCLIDPFYQIFKGDEVNAQDCQRAIDAMKEFQREGITLIVVFHSPKGFSGDRQLIDMISGSSMLSRFPESIIGLLNHAKDRDCRVVKCILRNYAPPDDVTIRYTGGQFAVCEDMEAEVESADNRAAARKRPSKADEFAALVHRWGAQIRDLYVGVGAGDVKFEMMRTGLSAKVAERVFAAISETAGAYRLRYDSEYGTFSAR